MKRFAFISRHEPTTDQIFFAKEKNVELVPVGDRDAFNIDPAEFYPWGERYKENFDGVVVVHPASALLLCPFGPVGIFENSNRDGNFQCVGFHIFEVIGYEGNYAHKTEVS